ncbi:hypothetical protein ACVB8X_40640 [Streptomyces sp. NRAIS4]
MGDRPLQPGAVDGRSGPAGHPVEQGGGEPSVPVAGVLAARQARDAVGGAGTKARDTRSPQRPVVASVQGVPTGPKTRP